MSLYTGCECPSCGKNFEAMDDIVVCPICGSPHHRACYKAAGSCANEQLHVQGKQWERPAPPPAADGEQPTVRCGNCGTENPPSSIFCNSCGHALANDQAGALGGQQQQAQAHAQQHQQYQQYQQPRQQAASQARATGQMPDFTQPVDFSQELEKGVTVKDAADYIGPGSYAFIIRFREMAATGRVAFNWSAFFFSFFYCFYRKMYKLGAVLLAIFLAALLPSFYYVIKALGEVLAASGGALAFPLTIPVDGPAYQGLAMVSSIVRLSGFGSMVFCGFFFNRMYFKRMIDKVCAVKDTGHFSSGSQECGFAIAHEGGVNISAVMMVIAGIFVFYIVAAYLGVFWLLK